ncbi:hypothetical protein [Candidatus Laterigemmans baculatus]|uniref:hypothetical protein n=1 Tax=Candidatus Laterigemmans baculatus TaxID=2770505 RepID=UPI0013DB4BEF|nr:hypothetical protein [Candidatus Laterigemmans baculatus]
MYAAVYLHFDGYPAHTGEALMQHYANQSDAEALVVGGELRSIDKATGHPEHYADGAAPTVVSTQDGLLEFARKCGARFVYVSDGRTWSCREL